MCHRNKKKGNLRAKRAGHRKQIKSHPGGNSKLSGGGLQKIDKRLSFLAHWSLYYFDPVTYETVFQHTITTISWEPSNNRLPWLERHDSKKKCIKNINPFASRMQIRMLKVVRCLTFPPRCTEDNSSGILCISCLILEFSLIFTQYRCTYDTEKNSSLS